MGNTLNDDLFFHTYFGDLKGVQAALMTGADPSATARRFWSKLYAQRWKWIERGSRADERESLFAKLWTDDEKSLFPQAFLDDDTMKELLSTHRPQERSVLCLAATFPDPAIAEALVECLLAAGAEPHEELSGEPTALHFAAQGKLGVLRRLLAAGALPTANGLGETALHVAAKRGDAEAVAALLAAGADPNAATTSGVTPLILACAHGDIGFTACEKLWAEREPHLWEETVVLLLQAGAEPNPSVGPDNLLLHGRARTAYGFALLQGDLGIQEKLRAAGATGHGDLASACAAGHLETVARLIAEGADIESPDSSGNTPLMNAAGNGHLAVVEALLEAGADTSNGRKEDGIDALARAVCTNQVEVVKRLAQAGMDVNRAYRESADTFTTLLIMATQRGFPEVTQQLVALGAKTSGRDSYGKTALDYARMTTWEQDRWFKTTLDDPELRALFDSVPMTEEAFYSLPHTNHREVDTGRLACQAILETAMQLGG